MPRSTEVTAFTLAYTVAMLIGVVGNTLLIYLVWKKPETRTLTSFMFVNMAVADLLVTLVVMPVSIAHIHTNGAWISGMIGEITCRCFYFAVFVSISASILCLVFIAIDRFFAVMYPFRRRVWFRKPKVLTPLVWILSMALMSITPVIVDLNEANSTCEYNFSNVGKETEVIQGIFIYFGVVNYLLPLTIMSGLYAIISYKLWIHEPPCIIAVQTQRERRKSKRKVVRMLIIVVSVFALCWLPGQAFQFFLVITKWRVRFPQLVMNISFWFGHANSAINPWLYIGLNKKFTLALSGIIRKKSRDEDSLRKDIVLHPRRKTSESSDSMQKEKGQRKSTLKTTCETAC